MEGPVAPAASAGGLSEMGKSGTAVREAEDGAAALSFSITERDRFERRGKVQIWEKQAAAAGWI